jgi:hypothetical protein
VNGDAVERRAPGRKLLRNINAHVLLLDAWRRRRRLGAKTMVAGSLLVLVIGLVTDMYGFCVSSNELED